MTIPVHINDLDTPVAVVDVDRLETNIRRFQSYLDQHHIQNRPHIKTHKIPDIARMQIEAGAVGITCQKLGEAEVMADAGIQNIFIPYNILGTRKLERLLQLAAIDVSVTADSTYTVDGLSAAANRVGMNLDVLVEFDTGSQRCGVQTVEQAVELAQYIEGLPGVTFGGLMTYPTNAQTDLFVERVKAQLITHGLPVKRVSAGGTATMWQAHTHPHITEYRAGMYIYGDRSILKAGAMTVDDCALHVITTVVSRPTADRGIVDGGSKTFSSDLLGLDGHGLILEYPEAHFYALSEEHGHIDFSKCSAMPQIGERVTVIPNHCCVVSNLFNQMVFTRGGAVETIRPVAARGLLT